MVIVYRESCGFCEGLMGVFIFFTIYITKSKYPTAGQFSLISQSHAQEIIYGDPEPPFVAYLVSLRE